MEKGHFKTLFPPGTFRLNVIPLCYLEFALQGTRSHHGTVAGFHLVLRIFGVKRAVNKRLTRATQILIIPRKFVGKSFPRPRLVLTLGGKIGPVPLALVDTNSGSSCGFSVFGKDLTF